MARPVCLAIAGFAGLAVVLFAVPSAAQLSRLKPPEQTVDVDGLPVYLWTIR